MRQVNLLLLLLLLLHRPWLEPSPVHNHDHEFHPPHPCTSLHARPPAKATKEKKSGLAKEEKTAEVVLLALAARAATTTGKARSTYPCNSMPTPGSDRVGMEPMAGQGIRTGTMLVRQIWGFSGHLAQWPRKIPVAGSRRSTRQPIRRPPHHHRSLVLVGVSGEFFLGTVTLVPVQPTGTRVLDT